MLVSIGLPVYKSKFLVQSIQSILDQTYMNFELIIINDASPDPVESIIKGFNDNRIKYYENETNIGGNDLAASWNKTLEKAKGMYFVLASDDDYYEPSFIEEMVKKAIKYPEINIFHSRLRLVNSFGHSIEISETCHEYEEIYDYMWHRILKNRKQMVVEFMFKTKELLKSGGFYSMPFGWGSDDITSFIMGRTKGIIFVNQILCNWRASEMNISSSHKIYFQKMLALEKYREWVSDFIADNRKLNPENLFLSELNEKADKEFYNRLCETSARFIANSSPFKIGSNFVKCITTFKLKPLSILGSVFEAYGKKLLSRY